ncbi:MAG TPA: hypothetical protein VHW45_01200, partial [Candidatus Sulfotelmatobacter sp.]|nr:hypothetical protein [Candidatus Sulfotelmatobacter sp.]
GVGETRKNAAHQPWQGWARSGWHGVGLRGKRLELQKLDADWTQETKPARSNRGWQRYGA